MSKYKNLILILLSVVLLAYAGFISIFPSIVTKTFNIDKFEEKMYEATSIVTTFDLFEYKIMPSLDTVITIRNFDAKYVDEQPLFKAGYMEIHTTPLSIFTKNFNIKSMYIKNATYSDQILPDNTNKIAFLPSVFNTEIFGSKRMTINPGSLKVKNLLITYVAPKTYKEKKIREESYTSSEVRDYLKSLDFSKITIK